MHAFIASQVILKVVEWPASIFTHLCVDRVHVCACVCICSTAEYVSVCIHSSRFLSKLWMGPTSIFTHLCVDRVRACVCARVCEKGGEGGLIKDINCESAHKLMWLVLSPVCGGCVRPHVPHAQRVVHGIRQQV